MSPLLKPVPPTEAEAWDIVGGLSKPSKMPGWAYGLPAQECITGSELAKIPGTTCHGCYALKGNYAFSNVKTAQYRRLEALEDPRWIDAFVVLLRGKYGKAGVFRWHDAGDLQSVGHLRRIVRIAELVPNVKFWLPTREYDIVAEYQGRYGAFPDNLCVRLSAHYTDQPVALRDYPGLAVLPTSTVHHGWGQPVVAPSGVVRDSIECRAYTRGNECGPCRACWSTEVKNVSYPKH